MKQKLNLKIKTRSPAMSDQIKGEEQVPAKKKSVLSSTGSKIVLSVVIFLFTVLAVKGIAFARHIHKFADGPGAFLIDRISETLDLSSDQKAKVEKIKDQIKEKMESKKSERENKFDEFADEFKKDNIDRNKLLELGQKKEQEMKEMKEFMLDKIIEFHSILTPQQRNKAVEEMKNMKEKFGKMHDRPGRPGDDREGFRNRKD